MRMEEKIPPERGLGMRMVFHPGGYLIFRPAKSPSRKTTKIPFVNLYLTTYIFTQYMYTFVYI
jgi:hypothetical protein